MSDDDKGLLAETLAEIRELKGAMKEFREHMIWRVERLERKEGEQTGNTVSVLSLLISGTALVTSIIINFFRNGGR